MATSRTGTAKYLRNSARVKRDERRAGLTHCPGYELRNGTHRECGRVLDYDTPLLPGSVEADHIVDWQFGGTDDVDNLRVLCRTCNQERNKEPVIAGFGSVDDFPMSRVW